MSYTSLIVLIASLHLQQATPIVHSTPHCDVRVPYLMGMTQIMQHTCDVACAEAGSGCMERCMDAQLSTTSSEPDGDAVACDAQGGIYQSRMGSCQTAFEKMLELSSETDVPTALRVVQEIYQYCSVETLCY